MRKTGSAALVCGLALWAGAAAADEVQRCKAAEVHIHKQSGQLILRCGGEERLRMPVTFGAQPTGHKRRSGDERTPEGHYFICNKHRSKRHYKFLALSYPNTTDAETAAQRGLIDRRQLARIRRALNSGRCPSWHTPLGGAIGIHGIHPDLNWMVPIWNKLSRGDELFQRYGMTDGCIATDNASIDQLWPLVEIGTSVYIHPAERKADGDQTRR